MGIFETAFLESAVNEPDPWGHERQGMGAKRAGSRILMRVGVPITFNSLWLLSAYEYGISMHDRVLTVHCLCHRR